MLGFFEYYGFFALKLRDNLIGYGTLCIQPAFEPSFTWKIMSTYSTWIFIAVLPKSINQSLSQIGQGVRKLWSDIQTNTKAPKQRLLPYIITYKYNNMFTFIHTIGVMFIHSNYRRW